MTCHIKLSKIFFNNLEPYIEFKRPNGTIYVWNKLTLLDEQGGNMWVSVTDAVVEAIGDEIATIRGKAIEAEGEQRTFRGVIKYKIDKITVLDTVVKK